MSILFLLLGLAPAVSAEPLADAPALPEVQSLRLAVQDQISEFGDRYPQGRDFLAQLDALQQRLAHASPQARTQLIDELHALQTRALLANPLLNFEKLLLIKRNEAHLALPQNWEGNGSIPRSGIDNEIDVLQPVSPEGKLQRLYRPEKDRFVGDIDLHFDADRLLFSMPDPKGPWRVWEIRSDGTNLHPIRQIDQPDIDNYDACYLPDGNIIFSSTAAFTGVPCVRGSSHIANLFLLRSADGNIRRLTFDQEHDWCPTVLNDGRILYLRWEYSDLPHFVSRILFGMNPDGTRQMEYYGSNSYWPNASFYARPVPNDPTRFVAIIGGHHGSPRMGELVLFDSARGRYEGDGALQRIPGRGKPVIPVIKDHLVDGSWPKFLHPWPLSDKYFLVSAKPAPKANWGIYLVDVFDNMTLIKQVPGQALLEPIPLARRTTPPVIPSMVQPDRRDATVYIADIYAGPGLAGIPRGTVKKLRLLTYNFAYYGMGGQIDRVGLDGPWDVKRIMGTVPVEPDGSVLFTVSANTPISIQPLDGENKALQLMRSWMTAMPGEKVSCVGCHEKLNTSPVSRSTLALRKAPAEITPWYGPTRGFSFNREVQPVLDRYCVDCHGGKVAPDLRLAPMVHAADSTNHYVQESHFPPAYLALKRFVRNATIESDMHLLTPMEFHADTTALVQFLKRGHHDVNLDAEAWDRLITWIDLNTPAHGTWHEVTSLPRVDHWRQRRRDLLKQYANVDDDPEAIFPTKAFADAAPVPARTCPPVPLASPLISPPSIPAAAAFQKLAIDLGNGIKLDLVHIPSGKFMMGCDTDAADQKPLASVAIGKSFWIGAFEITNQQYALFDPAHDSGIEVGDFLQFSEKERGNPVNQPRQPTVRISWRQATEFCNWLSARTGRRFYLPTEAQWEYACRAGTATPMWFGTAEADFSSLANLADASLHQISTYGFGLPNGAIPPWRPAIASLNDHFCVSAPVGTFKPNPWGLFDMHGNAAEWTRSSYRPYPWRDDDGRNDPSDEPKVVRGGSWYNRPAQATSAFRLAYPPYQRIYNVGFRVICESSEGDFK